MYQNMKIDTNGQFGGRGRERK